MYGLRAFGRMKAPGVEGIVVPGLGFGASALYGSGLELTTGS